LLFYDTGISFTLQKYFKITVFTLNANTCRKIEAKKREYTVLPSKWVELFTYSQNNQCFTYLDSLASWLSLTIDPKIELVRIRPASSPIRTTILNRTDVVDLIEE